MYSLIFLGIISFVLSLVLTPLVRNLAWHYGIIDLPDQVRKIHSAPIPRLGGVAIFASIIIAYSLFLVVRLSSGQIVLANLPLVLRLLPALAVVFGIGLIDDIVTASPWIRLAAEAAAAIFAWFGGVQIYAINGYSFSGDIVSLIVTVLWIVTCTNAINLIDGVDGLAAGVSLFASVTMAIAALLDHNFPMALALIPLAGALLGFLRYNFTPASIFLGDCGSLTVGFLLGCFGAVWSEKSTTLLGLTAPLIVLAFPLLDIGLAVVRRLLRGQPIFSADSSHIHHKLLSRGLSPRRLLFVIYGICAVDSAASLLLTLNHNENRDFVLVLLFLAAWLGLQQLGYTEFGAAKRLVSEGTIRSVLSAQLALEEFEREVNADITLEQSWDVLSRTCPQFGFSGILFHLGDVQRQWGENAGWQARIDFPGHGYISVWRETGIINQGASAVLFIDCVSRTFRQKLSNSELVNNL
ncbi:MAG: MraY family glycosyltransferase [Anaerolineaceae bacterium]|nr:MraY family glycosyltransferase [Anaerolineaceae bacterium]